MKKIVLLLLVCSLLLALAACAAAGTGAPGSEPASGVSPSPTGAETAAPTQTAAQTEPETIEDPEPEPVDTTASADTEESTEPAEEQPAETEPGALNLADTAWKAECIRDDKWVGLALDFYADGSLYYREGRMFSEYALYLDGLWRTEEDGTLELTLWYSPYDAWDRPDDYRVSAADVPGDCWYVRFSCEPYKGDCLLLDRVSERTITDGEEETWIELHPADPDLEIISLQELRDFGARDDEEIARLLADGQDDWDLFGYGGWTKFRGIAKAGAYYAAKVEYSFPITISAEELAQAAETGRITLQGQEYVYTNSQEEAEQYGLYSYDEYGSIMKLRADGQIGGGGYWVERAGDRYYFVFEVGGMISRLETVEERCWVMLDPETPIVIGPSGEEDAPKTLDEYGTVAAHMLSTPAWDDTDGFYVYIDLR